MLSIEQIQNYVQNSVVIFWKESCRFCDASIVLLDKLVEQGIIPSYKVIELDKDYTNKLLGEFSEQNGWISSFGEQYPSKPQIYIEGKCIGGNFELYKSSFNKKGPNLQNPFRF